MVCLTGLRNCLWVPSKWEKIIFVTLTTCLKPWITAHSSSNDVLLPLIRVTEASILLSGRQLNSTASFALEFLRQTIKYAIPGRAIFHDVFVFVVVPVIHDVKNWIPEIRRIGSSNKYLVLQINCASLWSFFNHTALQDTAWNFPLTFKRKVVECCWIYKCKLILKSINVWNKLDTGKSKTWN